MEHRRFVLVAGLLVPWVIVISPGGSSVFTGVALVDPTTLHVTPVYDYVFAYTRGLPDYLLAWPIGVAVYLIGIGSAAVGALFGVEDRRVTAAAVALAALTQVTVALGFLRRPRYVAIPVALVVLPAVFVLSDLGPFARAVREWWDSSNP